MTQQADYDWQEQAYDRWADNGMKGVLKAVTGAGKTRAGFRVIEAYQENNPEAKVLVVVPSDQIKQQWGDQWRKADTKIAITLVTYFKAVNMLEAGEIETDLMVLDECHSILSEKRSKVVQIPHKHVLGLSATPLESVELLGGMFMEIGWEEAVVSPFDITYLTFRMNGYQTAEYRALTQKMKNSLKRRDELIEEGKFEELPDLMAIIMQRRSYVYTLPQRVKYALKLAFKHADDRIIMFCERLEQVRELYDQLTRLNEKVAVYTSEMDTIKEYKEKRARILLTSRMIKQGFDDPFTTMGVIVSTPITELSHVQTIGRIVRYFPEKHAKIFVLLAERTSDEDLVRNGGMKGTVMDVHGNLKENIKPETEDEKEWRKRYHDGNIISSDGTTLFKKVGKGMESRRVYYECPELIQAIRRSEKRSGKFSLHETGVYSVIDDKKGRRYIKVAEGTFNLVEKPDRRKEWTQEDEDDLIARLTGGKK